MTLVKTQYNRRSFLKISTAAGGGMLIGFNWLMSCTRADEKLKIAIPNEWFEINGYIKIGDTGLVTIYSPNPEIGQNVMTSMPMIVAEELDVPWDHVIVEQGMLDSDAFKNPQFAGGSLSIMLGWEPLRLAGATGRWMLLEAAAREWGVQASDLSASDGIIREINGERSIGYGEIASKAVGIEVPEEIALKDPSDFKLIGTYQKNVEGPKVVTGKPLFGVDFQREGMKLAMIVQPPSFGMEPEDFNKDEILSMNGVHDAFIIDTSFEEGDWSSANAFEKMIALVGDTTWELMQAKKAVRASWKTLSEPEDSRMHAALLEEAVLSGESQESRKDGDPEGAFASASRVIERTYTAPFQAHNTMEPMNFFAHVTGDKAELFGPTQTPNSLRTSASKLLGIPAENISVGMTRMGGGFGRRLYTHFGLEAAAISRQSGLPVKLVYTREDDMTNGIYRPAYRSTYRAALNEDNELIGFTVRGSGISEGPVFPNRFPAGAVDNYEAHTIMVPSNISTGAWRAPRSHFTAGAEQAFLDEVAEAAGKDPIEFRLELFERAKTDPVGEEYHYDADRYAGVLKLVKEKSGWGTEIPGVHRGVAAYFCHNSYVAEVMDIVMENGQPRIKKVWCAVDCGIVINKEGAINMIQGGVVDGVGHSMYSELQFENGRSVHDNFNTYQLIRHNQSPEAIEVFFVESDVPPTGLGEPGLPPASGALANALYKATGRRYYNQPFVTDRPIVG
jgi:CO/xanthine dehydrogenase Mo-binding subunit